MEKQQSGWKYKAKHYRLIIVGLGATIIYGGLLGWLRLAKFDSPQQAIDALRSMSANNLGDLLTGVFGPVSFMWLILGYLQQQKELMVNTNALMLQADELRQSVVQQKGIAEATNEQLKANLRSIDLNEKLARIAEQPRFEIVESKNDQDHRDDRLSIGIRNAGRPAYYVQLKTHPCSRHIDMTGPIEEFGEKVTRIIRWYPDEPPTKEQLIYLKMEYQDGIGNAGSKTFCLYFDDSFQLREL